MSSRPFVDHLVFMREHIDKYLAAWQKIIVRSTFDFMVLNRDIVNVGFSLVSYGQEGGMVKMPCL